MYYLLLLSLPKEAKEAFFKTGTERIQQTLLLFIASATYVIIYLLYLYS